MKKTLLHMWKSEHLRNQSICMSSKTLDKIEKPTTWGSLETEQKHAIFGGKSIPEASDWSRLIYWLLQFYLEGSHSCSISTRQLRCQYRTCHLSSQRNKENQTEATRAARARVSGTLERARERLTLTLCLKLAQVSGWPLNHLCKGKWKGACN